MDPAAACQPNDRKEEQHQIDLKKQADSQAKLGLLMVNLGIAPKDQIFPNGVPSDVYTTLTSLKASGVMAPPRTQSSSRNRATWYNPLSWFQRRARPSSSYEADVEHTANPNTRATSGDTRAVPPSLSSTPMDAALQVASEMSSHAPHDERNRTSELPQQAQKPSSTAPAATAAPQIDYRQLRDDEILGLARSALADRTKLLGMEESVHSMLESIERTKVEYLTPSKALACEANIEAVVACYHRANLQLGVMEQKDALSRGRLLLQCGGAVDRLVACSEAAVRKYVEEE